MIDRVRDSVHQSDGRLEVAARVSGCFGVQCSLAGEVQTVCVRGLCSDVSCMEGRLAPLFFSLSL